MTFADRRIDTGAVAQLSGHEASDCADLDRAVPRLVVLIVEDDALLRMHAAEMIGEAGFDVIEAANADRAITVLEARTDIAIVFTDVDMPGSMNGLKLAHAVAKRWPPIRIVTTSGHFEIHDGDLPTGGLFIAKPYRAHQILAMLQALARIAP